MTALFVFDMDDVLYDYDWRTRMAELERITGLGFRELRSRWWNHEGEFRAEAGAFRTGAEYLAAANAALGSAIDVDTWLDVRRAAMTPRPASLAALARAAELGEVTLLTNNGALIDEHLPRIAPELLEWVDVAHLRTSSRYGARKPDPDVFRAVLHDYGVAAADTFFVDDMPENVEGARSIGITGHVYRDGAALAAAVEEFAASVNAPRS